MYEKKIAELIKQLGDERARYETAGEQLDVIKKLLSESQQKIQVRHLIISKIDVYVVCSISTTESQLLLFYVLSFEVDFLILCGKFF